ncbi:MAG: hypothetical protein E7015_03065 [Alphaproteobacteria bacterium]|nr:hypothetical protein [Alphaproteobacteria bacterium]
MMNYFKLFNLPVSYSIDDLVLTSVYLKKQKEFAGQDENVMLLNYAYSTLKNPVKRAEYFLSLFNNNVSNMPSKIAKNMFELREKYASLIETEEKNVFLEAVKIDVKQKIESLSNYEQDLSVFSEKFAEIKFLNSFLEKEKSDVYSRN